MVCESSAGGGRLREIDGAGEQAAAVRFGEENSGYGARRGIWLRGRLRAGARRDRALARADESDQGNQFCRCDRDRGAGSDHGRSAGQGAGTATVLSAGSGEHEGLHHRREHRDECRRAALFEIWSDAQLCDRARGGAGQRRGLAHGRAGAQEQDRVQSDRAVRGIGRDAREW